MLEHFELKNNEGFVLRGYLDKPESSTKVVVFLHGFTGSIAEHNMHFKTFSRMLEEKNIASIRFNYTGNEESDGTFLDFSIKRGISDTKQVIEYAYKLGFKEVILLGYSMGGMFASCVAPLFSISKLVLWSAASSLSLIWENIFNNWQEIEEGKFYNYGFTISKYFLDGLSDIDSFASAKKVNIPVLILQGDKDEAVDKSTALKYHEVFKNSQLYIIPNASHGYERFAEQKELFERSLNFITKD